MLAHLKKKTLLEFLFPNPSSNLLLINALQAFANSGLLTEFVDAGKRHCFISNIGKYSYWLIVLLHLRLKYRLHFRAFYFYFWVIFLKSSFCQFSHSKYYVYCIWLQSADNLGATVDLNILNFIHTKNKEFVMEVKLLHTFLL